MKIIELSYHEKNTGWTLDRLKFDNFNLLVGVSGVGKTKILEAIQTIASIAKGESQACSGIEWSVIFEIDKSLYFWSGEYENVDKECRVLEEVFAVDGRTYFERSEMSSMFNGRELPKVSPCKSLFNLFSEDPVISRVVDGFRTSNFKVIKNAYSTEKDLLDLPPQINPEHLISLINHYKEIFPQVEDIRYIEAKNDKNEDLLSLAIKELGTDWYPIDKLSSGMAKTLSLLLTFYLYTEGSIVLVDEFENSLGIDCIDAVAEIITSNPAVQYIVTSRHPYIINSIDMKLWKLVRRDGTKVCVTPAEELNLGLSKYEAYKQFIKAASMPRESRKIRIDASNLISPN